MKLRTSLLFQKQNPKWLCEKDQILEIFHIIKLLRTFVFTGIISPTTYLSHFKLMKKRVKIQKKCIKSNFFKPFFFFRKQLIYIHKRF